MLWFSVYKGAALYIVHYEILFRSFLGLKDEHPLNMMTNHGG